MRAILIYLMVLVLSTSSYLEKMSDCRFRVTAPIAVARILYFLLKTSSCNGQKKCQKAFGIFKNFRNTSFHLAARLLDRVKFINANTPVRIRHIHLLTNVRCNNTEYYYDLSTKNLGELLANNVTYEVLWQTVGRS